MNALEAYRTKHFLTFEALGERTGVKNRGTVCRHCRAPKIPGDAALLYHTKLGIPLEELRPDLWPNQAITSNQPHESA